MQSLQKKVKWSRGETADALEERTDTGITQVSVSKMENIIADIYGNIARRPALKIISQQDNIPSAGTPVGGYGLEYLEDVHPATFVFTVNQNKYVILVVGAYTITGFLIQNEKFIRKVKIQDTEGNDKSTVYRPLGAKASFAQSNNWAILSGVWDKDCVLRLTDTDDITVETFLFTAPWYAPNGTKSITVTDGDLAGLEFNKDGLGFTGFAWTDDSGISSPYSQIDTGIDGNTQQVEEIIPVGSIIKFPNLGAYMRVEGYVAGGHTIYFPETIFDGVLTSGSTVPTTGQYAVCGNVFDVAFLQKYVNGEKKEELHIKTSHTIWVQNAASATGYSVWNPMSATWSDVPAGSLDVRAFGPLLTPVANSQGKDTTVTVETGYVSLDEYLPMEFAFSQQRLYATKFTKEYYVDGVYKATELPGYVAGSQIARYNDFKNDYNTSAEAVVIDINTAYQEQVVYVADYNGLKIFTTDSEYAYDQQGGVIKQSANGSSPNCRPIVFGSTLLYADKSKRQIRALQYELQTDIFQSSVINTMCQQDLIFNPIAMVSKYDKENNTGSFVYVIQEPKVLQNGTWTQRAPFMASCNFVPGNQAQIWSRWQIPTIPYFGDMSTIVNAVVVNNKPWFIVAGNYIRHGAGVEQYVAYSLAELSYDNLLDFEIQADPSDTLYSPLRNNGYPLSLRQWKNEDGGIESLIFLQVKEILTPVQVGDPVYNQYGVQIGTVETVVSSSKITTTVDNKEYTRTSTYMFREDIIFPGATVSVFDGDEYKWDDTLDAEGKYTKSLAELTNPRVGFKINAELVSHPIDVGGKTYTDHKRIGKCVAVVRDTEPGAFTVCDKTGYTDNDKKKVNFYGCTGMKDQIRYTIKNINGAKFTIESLTMIIEYGTLDS